MEMDAPTLRRWYRVFYSHGYSPAEADRVAALIASYISLTPERRRAALDMMRDQGRLSELDRRES